MPLPEAIPLMLVNNGLTPGGRAAKEDNVFWDIGFRLNNRSAVRLTGLFDLRDFDVVVEVVVVDLVGDGGALSWLRPETEL